MNYLTKHFNHRRISPQHRIAVPLVLVKELPKGAIPSIWQERIYRYEAENKKIVVYSEETVNELARNDKKYFIKGVNFFVESKCWVSSRAETDSNRQRVSELNAETLDILQEVSSSLSLHNDDFLVDGVVITTYEEVIERRPRYFPVAVNRQTGEIVWTHNDYSGVSHKAATDKILVLISFECQVTALNIHTGELLWQVTPLDFDILTEEEQGWWREKPGTAQNSLHIYNNQVIIGLPGRKLVALDVNTGETLWHYRHDMSFIQTVVDWRGRLYSLSSEIYSRETGRYIEERPMLTIFDLNTRQIIHQHEITTKPKKLAKLLAPCHQADVTETHYIGLTVYGLLIAVNLETGKIDWQYNLEGNSTHGIGLFVCNNRVYAQVLRGFDPHNFIFEGEGGYIQD